jgi:hypothetical protein
MPFCGHSGYAVFLRLLSSNLLEALPEEVFLVLVVILCQDTTETIVCGDGRALIIEVEHPKGNTEEEVETALLVKILIVASAFLLQYAHGYENTVGH